MGGNVRYTPNLGGLIAPTISAGTPTSSTLPITISGGSGITSLTAEINDGGGWATDATLATNATSHTYSGLTASTSYDVRLNVNSGAVYSNVLTLSTGGGSGSGFAARPYFLQNDASRLSGYVSGAVSEWSGSSSNTSGQPLGFASLMTLAYNEASTASGSSYNDIVTSTPGPQSKLWHVALWAYLANNTAAKAWCADKVVAFVASNPTGSITSNEYQHIEDFMMNTALIVDMLYDEFSSTERSNIATYVNGINSGGNTWNSTFWPYGDVHNNYNQNRILSKVIAGLCSEGWNSNASTIRAEAESILDDYVTGYTSPVYVGPQISEGSYYGTYIRNFLWAARQYDAVMGTTYQTDVTVTAANQLNLFLYQLRPHLKYQFHEGSLANSVYGNLQNVHWALARQLMHQDSSSTEAKLLRTILSQSGVYGDGNNFEARSNDKAFNNFYWRVTGITGGALTSKTDRMLVLPQAGGAKTYIRSADGWNNANTCRAVVMFHQNCDWEIPGYSHDSADAPGFQWGNADNFVVTDPEYGGSSGIAAENNGYQANFANIVTLASDVSRHGSENPLAPTILFSEDNTGAGVPHYYKAIDAQPYWNNCTAYKRHYVWLDDLQVVVIWDRVTTSGADTKTWRLHVDTNSALTISSNKVTATIQGNSTIQLEMWDLFATSSGAWSANLLGSQGTTTAANTTTTFTDSSKSWITNNLTGKTLQFALPLGTVTRTVVTNTATTLTFDSALISTTSSTSLTIGTGSQSLTVGTGLFFSSGQTVLIDGSSGNTMTGTVTSYNSGSGALVVNVTAVAGSGTIASWAVTLTAVPSGRSYVVTSETVRRDIYRITQTDTANDFISLKVLGINGRLTAATLSTGTDGTGAYKQADLTINGVSRAVRFYDNGTSHATVS